MESISGIEPGAYSEFTIMSGLRALASISRPGHQPTVRYAAEVDGILAQYIAVALHGSAWLAARGAPPALEVNNSTFQYVSHVHFEYLTDRRIDAVDDWLEQLSVADVAEIALALPIGNDGPEGGPTGWRERTAFVNDDPAVGLWVQTDDGARLWRAEWRSRHRDPLVAPSPQPRPWCVTYRESLAQTQPERAAVDATRYALLEAIDIAMDFAREHEMHPWDEELARARELDMTEQPQPPFHADIAPACLSLERRRLLSIATGAHVFGGMGTWNDWGFSDRPTQLTYQEISDRLFMAVMRSFGASVNTRRPETRDSLPSP